MQETGVRPARVEDAEAIARAHLESHREAYVATGRIPEAYIEGWTLRMRAASQREHIAAQVSGAAPSRTVVALVDGEVVGFAAAGPSEDEDRAGEWALYAIYLLEAHHGSGLGQALLDAAIGDRAASLWVLAENPRAHAFYARNGFVPDGVGKEDERWPGVHEVRLVRP